MPKKVTIPCAIYRTTHIVFTCFIVIMDKIIIDIYKGRFVPYMYSGMLADATNTGGSILNYY